MADPAKIIQDLEDTIAESLDRFNGRMPKVEQDLYARILELSSELETDSTGRIKPNVKNIRLIGKIKQEITNTIFDSQYSKELDKLVETYDKVATIQNQYFTSVVAKFTAPKVLEEIRKLSIQNVVESLNKEALGVNISNPVRSILTQAVTSGGSRKEFTEQVRAFLLESDSGKGALTKYATQITTDALNQYSAQYNAMASDDLDFKWFVYSGSLRKTSRPFCIELIKASRSGGCMEYIHQSQIPELLSGRICGKSVPLYDKTDLPQGMYEGTNPANFKILRGGYNCNHQLTGVPTSSVPKKYRDQFPD